MEKLIILDFCKAEVHVYDIDDSVIVDEDFIECLGFNSNDCQWMNGKLEITFHKKLPQ